MVSNSLTIELIQEYFYKIKQNVKFYKD